jgi:hypothetical protein
MRIELAMKKAELIPHGSKRKFIAKTANVGEQKVRKYIQIKECANPKILAQLKKGEMKIGTAHKTMIAETKTVTNLLDDTALKNLNSRVNYINAAHNNISALKKMYRFVSENNFATGEESALILNRLSAQNTVLEKVLKCKKTDTRYAESH